MADVVRIAIVGATGLVGRTALSILEGRPWAGDPPVLQAAQAGSGPVAFRGQALRVGPIDEAPLRAVDAVLLCGDEALGRSLAPPLAARGVVVVDLSPAWRMQAQVPLVVVPVNPRRLYTDPPSNLLANPNCTAAILAVVLAPLLQRWGAHRLVVSTYQSASGAGRAALAQLDAPTPATPAPPAQGGGPPGPGLRENVLPAIGPFQDGESLEERKIVDELRKILGLEGVAVSATAVRVPTRVGHAAAITLWPRREVDPRAAAALLRQAQGVEVWADDRPPPTPIDAAGRDPVLVGRIRRPSADPGALALWAVGDNLRRGGALNAVELIEARLGLAERP